MYLSHIFICCSSVAHSPGLQFGNQCNVVKNFRRQLSDLAKKTPKSPPNTLRYAALKQTSLAGVAITGNVKKMYVNINCNQIFMN